MAYKGIKNLISSVLSYDERYIRQKRVIQKEKKLKLKKLKQKENNLRADNTKAVRK